MKEEKEFINQQQKHPSFTEEELEISHRKGDTIYSLNLEMIRSATHDLFRGKTFIPSNFYEETVLPGNYMDFDLDNHGLPNLIGDLSLLTKYLQKSVHIVRNATRRRTNRILFMGCGTGRVEIPASIELAKREKLALDEIFFNDKFPHHVEIAREKFAECYNTRQQSIDGVKVHFLEGDFTKIANQMRNRFDVVLAMWFVTSEIVDFSSVENLRQKRKELFLQIKHVLIKHGVFVEDVPFSEGLGTYYYLGRLKTYLILKEMGILEGENDHILITDFGDIQKNGFSKHIRYVPANGKHREELRSTGFEECESAVNVIPIGIKNSEQLKKEFSLKKVRTLFEGNSIDNLLKHLTKKELELLNIPSSTAEEAQLKKTILYRANGN